MSPNVPLVIGSAAIAAWFANSGLMLQAFAARPEALEARRHSLLFGVPTR